MKPARHLPVDARILWSLRRAEEGVAGTELAEELGISRAAIWARVEELRRAGYDIEATPHSGYRLRGTPDVLHGDDLLSRLGPTRVIGRDIRVFEQTSSTNDVVDKLARDGVAEGVVVFAESQTKGRGRLGRRWTSPARRGLWFSVLLRPAMRSQSVPQITIMAAVALRRALGQATGLKLRVKWPNDLLVNGRKVAGILTEMSGEQDCVRHVVLGIGVDVNQSPAEFPRDLQGLATSLRMETGRGFDRAELATTILRELDGDYRRGCAGGFEAIAEEWEAACDTLGRQIVVTVGDRRLRGRAESLDADGALRLRTEHGHLERVTGGDVVTDGG